MTYQTEYETKNGRTTVKKPGSKPEPGKAEKPAEDKASEKK